MRLGTLLGIIFVLIHMGGCAGSVKELVWVVKQEPQDLRVFAHEDIISRASLIAVKRSADAEEHYGQSVIGADSSKQTFEDDMISISWLMGCYQFDFTIHNKTDRSIKILWDEAAYVSKDGSSQRVMHKSIKYSQREMAQVQSIVVRGQKLSDIVVPTNYVLQDGSSGWIHVPLILTGLTTSRSIIKFYSEYGDNIGRLRAITRSAAQQELDNKYSGKQVQILLPLETGGIVYEYIFIFNLEPIILGKGTPIWWQKDRTSSLKADDQVDGDADSVTLLAIALTAMIGTIFFMSGFGF